MRKKRKNEVCIAIKNDIFNNMKSYIIISVIFLVGLFLGVMFVNQTE